MTIDDIDRAITIPLLRRCDGIAIRRCVTGGGIGYSVTLTDRATGLSYEFGAGGDTNALTNGRHCAQIEHAISWLKIVRGMFGSVPISLELARHLARKG